MQCNARVTWFREPGHVQVDDVCVLENGHMEYDHLPAMKAAEQVENRQWNAAVGALTAVVMRWLDEPDNDVTESRRKMLLDDLAALVR